MKTSQATLIDSQATTRPSAPARSWSARIENLPKPEILAFLFTLIVMFLYRELSQPEGGDSAIWDYVAQCILRGQIPYRDVVEIKTPGSAYLSAIAMWIGTRLGLRDLMAVRLMQMVLMGLLSTTTYLVALHYLRSRSAALIAFMVPLMSGYFVGWMLEGTQPKLSMTLFGMLTILLIGKDRPFWAGVCSMLSCLCWQPGLLFTGTAVLIFSRYFASWRDLRGLKVMTGAALPLVIVVLYFYSAGALKDFWTWTVAYNYNVYGPEGAKNLSDQLIHIWRVIWRVMGVKVILFVLGLAGLLMFIVERAGAKLKWTESLQSPLLFKDALIIAPAVYLTFCLVDFQAGPDLIPLFPFIGIFGGWFVVKTGRSIRRSQVINQKALFKRMTAVTPEVVPIALVITLACAASHKTQGAALREQSKTYQTLSDMLSPDDKIYASGAIEVLVLLKRPNLNPYIMWDKGKDIYVAKEKYGGSLAAIIDEIESQRPRLVALSRFKGVGLRAELERWVAEHYDKLEGYNDSVYLRRPS